MTGALTSFLEDVEEKPRRTGRRPKKGREGEQESLGSANGPVSGPPEWATVETFSVRTTVLAAGFAAWSEALRPQMAAHSTEAADRRHGGQHRLFILQTEAGRTPARGPSAVQKSGRYVSIEII